MNKKTIKDIDVKGKKVFVRVDYNVPFDDKMNITNDTRMVRTLPTLNYLLDGGAALILACHIGRPTEAKEEKFSTKPDIKLGVCGEHGGDHQVTRERQHAHVLTVLADL